MHPIRAESNVEPDEGWSTGDCEASSLRFWIRLLKTEWKVFQYVKKVQIALKGIRKYYKSELRI